MTDQQTVGMEADSLASETGQTQNEFGQVTNGFDGTPQTMGNITTRIIGQWQEEEGKSTEELRAYLRRSQLSRYYEEFAKVWWHSPLQAELPKWAIPFLWLSIILVVYMVSFLFFGGMSAVLGLGIIPPVTMSVLTIIGVYTGIPFWKFRKRIPQTMAKIAEIEQQTEEKAALIVRDPVFLVSEVREHVEKVQEDYRAKLIDLKGKFEKAYRKPRLEIDRELRRLRADRKELLSYDPIDFPEREELLEIVQAEIDACNSLRREASAKEKELAVKLQQIDLNVTQFEQSLETLDDLKEKYDDRAARLERFSRYQREGDKWSDLLEAKRLREMREIETAIEQLEEEVTGTQFALSEVATLLPGSNALKLQEFRSKLLN